MESGRSRGYHDHSRLPPLTLGLSSVRLIVNKLEAEYGRAFESPANHQLVKYDPTVDDDFDTPLDSSTGRASTRFLAVLLSRCIPSVSFGNFGALAVLVGFIAPRMISYLVLYPFCRLVFGTLYPAYASYKAVRTKNLKEYVKWMMYWIVFALFTCIETFTDVFLSWFPFYYEVKIVLVLWLLSPATKGSSILYRKFVHPALCRREQEIDEYIAKAKDQGYHTVLNLGTKGVNYATTVIMQTAIKGGGGLVQQLRKSYSLSDLTECEPRAERDEADDVLAEPQLIRRNTARSGYSTRRSASESNSRTPMYFPEVDVDVRNTRTRLDEPDLSHIKSSEDISSGYSSADNSGTSLTRAGSISGRIRKPAARTQLTAIKRPQPAEDSEVIIEELRDDDLFDYTSMPPLMNVPSPLYLSHSDPPFIYQYIGDQVRIVQMLGNRPLITRDQTNITYLGTRKGSLNEILEQNIPVERINHIQKPDTSLSHVDDNDNDNDDTFFESTDLNDDVIFVNDASNNAKESVELKIIASQCESHLSDADSSIEYQVKISKTEPEIIIKLEQSLEIATAVTDNNIAEETNVDTSSLHTLLNENDTVDSDDEASFGTPENSPRSKRKLQKGKYGKGKAPPVPRSDDFDTNSNNEKDIADNETSLNTSQESLIDIINNMPKTVLRDNGSPSSLVVNPIAEKKRRHKSKSPNRIPKGTAIGKLFQLPGKLAFWNKNDKSKNDNVSISSEDHSRRSSEKFDDSHNTAASDFRTDDISNIEETGKGDDQISFKDASDFESEVITQNIMVKSDALQKLIDAKIESHPEYKYCTNEMPTTSKSTDV